MKYNCTRHQSCFFIIVVIVIHEFHGNTSLKQNFRAAGNCVGGVRTYNLETNG